MGLVVLFLHESGNKYLFNFSAFKTININIDENRVNINRANSHKAPKELICF